MIGPDGRNVHVQVAAVPNDGLLFKAVTRTTREVKAPSPSRKTSKRKTKPKGKLKKNADTKASQVELEVVDILSTSFFIGPETIETLW